MFTLSNFLFVGIGAALGAWLRWILTYFFSTLDPSLPHGTLAVNLIGGLLIGLSFAAMQSSAIEVSEEVRLILNVGFLGALTTFSTYSLEIFHLFLRGEVIMGVIFTLLNVLGALLFCFLGWSLFNLFFK